MCYWATGCVTGVLPNYWVRYRTNGCFSGVNDRVCYRTTGLVAGVLPGDRAGYRRIAERQGATGVLPDDRVCYRRVAELPGVLPDEQVFYRSYASGCQFCVSGRNYVPAADVVL